MSAFDDIKKANNKTFQYYMSKIAGLKRDNYEICVPLKVSVSCKGSRVCKKEQP